MEWLWTLDLSHEWPHIEAGTLPLDQACMLVAGKLAALPPSAREAPSEALRDLTELWTRAAIKAPTVEEFDELLTALYDWGDARITPYLNTCWIKRETP